MYIAPNSVIKICKNVPLDNTYKNTILFSSANDQTLWFATKTSSELTFTSQYYQRHGNNKLKLQICADDIFDANYLCFINTSYSNKWFYAFILDVEYINNETCEITYEIDEVQTWLFDFSYGDCYIEREHVDDDTIGLHILDEQLPLGELVVTNETTEYEDVCVALMRLNTGAIGAVSSNTLLYSNINFRPYHLRTPESVMALKDDIQTFTDDNTFAGLICSCSLMYNESNPENLNPENSYTYGGEYTFSVPFERTFRKLSSLPSDPSDIEWNTYTPHNNKLYTYPYCFINADNRCGDSEVYKIEDFPVSNVSDNSLMFCKSFTPFPLPDIAVAPVSYHNVNYQRKYSISSVKSDIQYALHYNNFPMLPTTLDSFNQWFAYAKANFNISQTETIINSVVEPIIDIATARPVSAVTSLYSGITSAVTQQMRFNNEVEYHKVTSKQMSGSLNNAVNHVLQQVGFKFSQFTVSPESAKRIDEYFDRFGYKTMRVGRPVLTSRRWYNYIKCIECDIKGDIPESSRRKLRDIHLNGITFWHSSLYVGNYRTDNTIISG